jgi:fused signal recognition particle receptor
MFDNLRKKLSDAIKGIVKKESAAENTQQDNNKSAVDKPHQEIKEVAVAVPPEAEKEQPVKSEIKEEPTNNHTKDIETPAAEVQPPTRHHTERKEEKRDTEPLLKTSIGTKIKGAIFGSVRLNDSEIEAFSEKIRISLLESEVSYKTADEIFDTIKTKLEGSRLNTKNLDGELRGTIRESLLTVLQRMPSGTDITGTIKNKMANGETPVKILFLGPNGTGKTTTMAKIAHKLKGLGITCAFSASDTFRAAAIEQTEIHANRLGIPVVKSKYGADPASVAFDAIAYAMAHGINAVLIDSAGRQETNRNLINELHKMVRVAKPDIVIFVGESTAGSNLSDQIIEFNKVVKIDGIVLTKLDCDAKGGNAISIAGATGIPILFFGIGEGYDAIIPYSAEFVVNSILPNN